MSTTFDALIEDGWSRHEAATAEVVDALERQVALADDAPKCAKYAALVAHAAGEHQDDWAKAARLIAAALEPRALEPALAGALAQLAVAQLLAGDAMTALGTEMRAVALAPTEAAPRMLRMRLLATEALFGSARREQGLALLDVCLDAADTLDSEGPAARGIAVATNNLASTLLDLPSRTPAEAAAMTRTAAVARRCWLKAGDWRNHERADYLVALVANAVGEHDQAAKAAKRGLALIAANGKAPIDEAFLRLALTRAHRGRGEAEEAALELAAADRLAAGFDADTGKWFARERCEGR